jgi:hypothetical protein
VAAASAAEIALTREGEPAATVVLAARPSTAARFAAAELVEHVRRITGATLPVVTDATPVSGPRVLIGPSAASAALGIDAAALKTQEYLIRWLPDTLVLLGREEMDGPGAHERHRRTQGKHGLALDFDGEKDAFVVPDSGFVDEAGTLEAWVWLPAEKPTRCHGTILRLDGSDPWTYHILQRDQGTSTVSYMTYDGQQVRGVRSPDLAEGWHHVVGTYSVASGTMALWIDGQRQGEAPYVRTTCKDALLGVGSVGTQVGNTFRGRIDEVRISNVVRDLPREAAGGPYAPDPGTACLYHFDDADGTPVDSVGGVRGAPLPELFGENGTLYAVYDFLERCCGVRWYAPTELGTVCPQTPTLSVQGPDLRRAPAMVHRWVTPTAFYFPGPPDRVAARDLQRWKLRQRIGGQAFWVCHSFEGYYERFLKDHPDWFAQGYTGRPPQLCYTHPDLIRQVIQDACDYFDGKGKQSGATAEGDVFGLVPMDNNQWCTCPRCQAEMNPAQRTNEQFNNGKASNYVWGFVCKVAEAVRRSHPGKWIGALAYADYAYVPETVTPGPNVVVQLCLHTRNWWCPSMEVNDLKVLNDWRGLDEARPLYLWLYYCFPALNAQYGDFAYFPGFFARTIVQQMQRYEQARIRGIFMEHSSEFGQTTLMDQLEFYVTLKLADDPSLDGNALIAEFFERYYGAAAKPMAELYGRIEDTFSNPANYPEAIRKSPAHQHQTEELAWGSLGTPERMLEFAALMARAQTAARTPDEQARVDAFRKGIWEPMAAGRKRYETRQGKQAEAIRSVRIPKTAAAGGNPDRVDFGAVPVLPGWSSLSGEATERRLELRATHDGRFLYLQLSEWTDSARLVSGGMVWDGDDWELFVAAERNAAYRQVCVAPNGKSTRAVHNQDLPAWDLGEQLVSDTTAADRWTVRLALPLDRLLDTPLASGSSFYANVYRASPGASNLLAWAPLFAGGFHHTDRLPQWTLD